MGKKRARELDGEPKLDNNPSGCVRLRQGQPGDDVPSVEDAALNEQLEAAILDILRPRKPGSTC